MEIKNDNCVRYACTGTVDEKERFTGLVYGYEGGGEYSEALIFENKYIPNYDEHIDCPIEWEEQVDIFNKLVGENMYALCYKSFDKALDYNNEICCYFTKSNFVIKDELVYSELPEGVNPPSYCNTFWENDKTSSFDINELDKITSSI